MARILILNQYYTPDTAATGTHAAAIAERLAQEGHEVNAIVGQPSYAGDARDEVVNERRSGVLVTRIGVGRARGREQTRTRIATYARYLRGATLAARGLRPDVVVCFHIPPVLPLLGLAIAARSRARLVYIPQDIHPDILLATGFFRLPGVAERAWNLMTREVLRRADVTIAHGDGMRTTLVNKGAPPERVRTVSLWAEPELQLRPIDRARRDALGLRDEFVVLHAGNMGLMHPLMPALQAAKRLESEGVAFLFAGGGVRRALWERYAEELGLKNVKFLDFQQGENFASLVAAADVALVSLDMGMERLAVPSRSFTFMAGGRPVIAHMAYDADVARIVRSTTSGWHAWGAEALSDLLLRLSRNTGEVREAGRCARIVYEQQFTRSIITAKYADLVASLALRGRKARAHDEPRPDAAKQSGRSHREGRRGLTS